MNVSYYEVYDNNGTFFYYVTGLKLRSDGSTNYHRTSMWVKA